MKDKPSETNQHVDASWQESVAAPRPSSAPPESHQALAELDQGWDAHGLEGQIDVETVDEGWEVVSPSDGSGTATRRRKRGAKSGAGAAPAASAVTQAPATLGKKERRALERDARARAEQRAAERKLQDKSARKQRRAAEQQALAEARARGAGEQQATLEEKKARAAASKAERKANPEKPAAPKRVLVQAEATDKKTTTPKPDRRAGISLAPWLFAAVILAVSVLLAFLRP